MAIAFQVFAVVGMLWAVFISWLILAVQDKWTQALGPVLLLLIVMLTVFVRLFALRQWAAVVVCLYCAWNVLDSGHTGLWQWTVGWSLTTLMLTSLTYTQWHTLRPGP